MQQPVSFCNKTHHFKIKIDILKDGFAPTYKHKGTRTDENSIDKMDAACRSRLQPGKMVV
jgi:hypothetical protein